MTEDDLLTDEEVKALLDYADADLSSYGTGGARRREPDEYRLGHANPWRGFGELLRCYHATGARTSELLAVRVADFQPRSRQIVLSSHKRSETLKVPIPRAIALNDEAFAIIQRRCGGRHSIDPVFTQPRNRRPWNRHSVSERFRAIRERVGVRQSITIYSFRHLWISEMLHGGRRRAAGRPHGGNLSGDDRAGLWTFPQPVLPGSPSQARSREGKTRALT